MTALSEDLALNHDPAPRSTELPVPRFPQPDDVTCGPTCLLSVLRYYGDQTSFERVLEVTPTNPDGGTLAVFLGLAARRLGYSARVYSYNYRVLDPTWSALDPDALQAKLISRSLATPKPKLRDACRAYSAFLAAGGEVRFDDLGPELLVEILGRRHPILCGLSATYLYGHMRERPDDNEEDDVRGDPVGHFLVISGHEAARTFSVRDPDSHAPHGVAGVYRVAGQRLINAILLGIVSYDAVLLEVWPS